MRSPRLLVPTLLVVCATAITAAAMAQEPPPPAPVPPPAPTQLTGGGKISLKVKNRANTVQVGIADEKSHVFGDVQFRALGIRTARRSVSWDMFDQRFARAEVDQWLKAARAAGITPLITFGRSRVRSRLHTIPTRARMLNAFRRFRQQYPWVKNFVASNESNHSDPGFKRPKLAAQYYRDMRRACPTCRIAAATILEVPGREKYMRRWIRQFVRAAKQRPRYWAIHNYVSANRLSLKGTKAILRATKTGEVWITETGGLVKRRSNFAGRIKMREGRAHAVDATEFILGPMLQADRRIKRLYLYHWNPATLRDTWDSALVDLDGTPRDSLAVLRARLARG